jgi:hypothetical protein
VKAVETPARFSRHADEARSVLRRPSDSPVRVMQLRPHYRGARSCAEECDELGDGPVFHVRVRIDQCDVVSRNPVSDEVRPAPVTDVLRGREVLDIVHGKRHLLCAIPGTIVHDIDFPDGRIVTEGAQARADHSTGTICNDNRFGFAALKSCLRVFASQGSAPNLFVIMGLFLKLATVFRLKLGHRKPVLASAATRQSPGSEQRLLRYAPYSERHDPAQEVVLCAKYAFIDPADRVRSSVAGNNRVERVVGKV